MEGPVLEGTQQYNEPEYQKQEDERIDRENIQHRVRTNVFKEWLYLELRKLNTLINRYHSYGWHHQEEEANASKLLRVPTFDTLKWGTMELFPLVVRTVSHAEWILAASIPDRYFPTWQIDHHDEAALEMYVRATDRLTEEKKTRILVERMLEVVGVYIDECKRIRDHIAECRRMGRPTQNLTDSINYMPLFELLSGEPASQELVQ